MMIFVLLELGAPRELPHPTAEATVEEMPELPTDLSKFPCLDIWWKIGDPVNEG